MSQEKWIVTVKEPKNTQHDPKNKVTSNCTYSEVCTDSTGEHHSFVIATDASEEQIKETIEASGVHVTRIERAKWYK